MEVLSVKKYNDKQTNKWQEHCNKARSEGRHFSCMPQLAMYVFNQRYGYVAFDGKTAIWDKSKKGVIQYWNDLEIQKKVRGY